MPARRCRTSWLALLLLPPRHRHRAPREKNNLRQPGTECYSMLLITGPLWHDWQLCNKHIGRLIRSPVSATVLASFSMCFKQGLPLVNPSPYTLRPRVGTLPELVRSVDSTLWMREFLEWHACPQPQTLTQPEVLKIGVGRITNNIPLGSLYKYTITNPPPKKKRQKKPILITKAPIVHA